MPHNWIIYTANISNVEQISAFNTRIFTPDVGIWARELISGAHPRVSVGDVCVVENSEIPGECISSMCLIRQNWMFEDLSLNVGQLELVGTDEQYRGLGLIRHQLQEWFIPKLAQNNCVLACVQGIPALYQKFGFHFGIPVKGGTLLSLEQLPEQIQSNCFSIRQAKLQDMPDLHILYSHMNFHLHLASVRDVALWTYQEGQSPASKHAYETFVLEEFGKITGYFRVPRNTKQDELIIKELAVKSYDGMIAILAFVRELAISRRYSSIILQLPASHPVLKITKSWGAATISPFAWQVRIVNWVYFFNTIRVILEKRISRSLLHRFSGQLTILLTDKRVAIAIHFNLGKIIDIKSIAASESSQDWHIKMTESLFTMLSLGYRNRSELEDLYLETYSRKKDRYLIDTLFPKLDSYIYQTY